MSDAPQTPAQPAKERPVKPPKAPGEASPRKNAKRTPEPDPFYRRGPGRFAAWTVALVLAVAGMQLAWKSLEPHIRSLPRYAVTPDKIVVNDPPAWVPSGLKADVLRRAGLDQPQSLLDEDLVRRISTAFSLHPWVRQVRVAKHAGGVRVDLNYRKAVLAVESSGRLEPVDVEGIRLPEADVAPAEKARLPRLVGVAHGPAGPAGTAWGNDQVAGAARVADALHSSWAELGLAQIEAAPRTFRTPEHEPDLYYLFTPARRTRIVWGCAPGLSQSEPASQEKVARLKKFLAAHGKFDHENESFDLDLRPADQILKTPRLAGADGDVRR